MGVKLEQLQVPQQQGGDGDLLGARDLCELAKVSDISTFARILPPRQKVSATLSARRVAKITALRLARRREFAESKVRPRASTFFLLAATACPPPPPGLLHRGLLVWQIIPKLNTARSG